MAAANVVPRMQGAEAMLGVDALVREHGFRAVLNALEAIAKGRAHELEVRGAGDRIEGLTAREWMRISVRIPFMP